MFKKFALVLALGLIAAQGLMFAAEDEAATGGEATVEVAKVYQVGEGKKYHTTECKMVVKAKEKKGAVKEMTVAQAEEAKLEPCKLCHKDKKNEEAGDEKGEETK